MRETATAGTNAPLPLLERPQSAVTLAAASGAMNAWTLANVGSFATVQSGNLVTAGFYGVQGDYLKVVPVLSSVLAFGAGAYLCAMVITVIARRGQEYSKWVLGGEALILVACGVLAGAGALPSMAVALTVSFVAGVQGNAFHRDKGMIYGNTAVTFVVQMTFSMLGRATVSGRAGDGQPDLRTAGLYGSVLVAFACGAAAGFLLDGLWSAASLVAVSATLAVLALLAATGRRAVDPRN